MGSSHRGGPVFPALQPPHNSRLYYELELVHLLFVMGRPSSDSASASATQKLPPGLKFHFIRKRYDISADAYRLINGFSYLSCTAYPYNIDTIILPPKIAFRQLKIRFSTHIPLFSTIKLFVFHFYLHRKAPIGHTMLPYLPIDFQQVGQCPALDS